MENFSENDVKNIISQMGGGSPAAPAASASTTSTESTNQNPNTSPPDSTGQQQTQQAAAAAQTSGAQAQTDKTNANGAAAAQAGAPAFDLTKIGGGRYKSIEEIDAEITRIKTLEEQLNEAKARPQFASDRHKKMFEITSKFEAEEAALDALHRELSIARLPIDKLPDHQLRYEAFKLDPKNQGLTEDQLQVLFAEDELSRFGDSTQENGQTAAQKIRAQQATLEAKNLLNQKKQEFMTAKAAVKTPEQIASETAEYRAFVQQTLSKFDGVELNVSGLDESTQKKFESKINFKLDPSQKHVEKVVEAVADPQGWWANKLVQYGVISKDGKGEVNLEAFGRLATLLEFLPEIQNQLYKQGRADMLAEEITARRNPSSNQTQAQTPGQTNQKKTAQGEMLEGALKSIGFPG